MRVVSKKVLQFLVSEEGPTAVEYAVMLTFIVIVCLTAIATLGQESSATFGNVANSLSTMNGS